MAKEQCRIVCPLKSEKIKKIIRSGKNYTIQNGSFCFLPGNRLPQKSSGSGLLGRIQDISKRYGKLYYALLYPLSPVLSTQAYRKTIRDMLEAYQEEHVILNLGSGPTYLHGRKDIINVDIFAFDEVDIVSEAGDLPIEDESIDFIINVGTFEHVREPIAVVNEMYRVLRKGGQIFCYLPFIVPYHAAPDDFHRWTMSGTERLFSDFDEVSIFVGAGPTSGLLYVIQEWLAVLLSFGSRIIHDILFLTFMVLSSPIKLLDLFMVKLPCAQNIASGFCLAGKK
jgi:SAM-dependent methyltransferase